MKKIFLMAALLAAALGARAQQQDTTSIMLQHLARTNYNVRHINDALRTHAAMAIPSFALTGVSVVSFLQMAKYDPNVVSERVMVNGQYKTIYPAQRHKAWRTAGIATAVAGGVLFACSFIPIWTKTIHLNERGLVIELDK